MTNVTTIPPTATGAERRLQATGMTLETAVGIVGCLIILVADSQSLSLVPLVPLLEKQYSLSATQASWALSSLVLVGAAWAPTLTRLGDKLGMRRLVLAGLAMSVLGNLLSAVSVNFPMFVASRAILGLSAAVPLIYAILRVRSASERRTNIGVGILSTATGFGTATSFLLSGIIIQANGSIRTVFWAMTALSVVALALSWWILPDGPRNSAQTIDWLGAFGVSAGLVCIVLAVTQGNAWHWSSPTIIGLFVGGAAIFALWALWEYRIPNPLINVRRVFKRTPVAAFVMVGLFGAIGIYTNLTEATYLEMPSVVGYGFSQTVLQVAYVMCAIAVAAVVGGLLSGPVITRLGPRKVLLMSGALTAIDFFLLAFAHGQIWQFVLSNIVWGAAFGFGYAAAYATFLQVAAPGEAAMYSSASTVFGAAVSGIGPGIYAVILTGASVIPHTQVPVAGAFRSLYIVAGCAGAAIFLLALLVRRYRFVPANGAEARTVDPVDVDPNTA
jgi:MFS family permease